MFIYKDISLVLLCSFNMNLRIKVVLTPSLGETHAVPHNRLPQARLSDFDETWHICSPYGPSATNGVFLNLDFYFRC